MKEPQGVEFIESIKDYIVNTSVEDYKSIVTLYEKKSDEFSGNFENAFGTSTKEINADPYLIAKAIDENNSIILTDEILTKKNDKGRKKLNIPNFAKSCAIDGAMYYHRRY